MAISSGLMAKGAAGALAATAAFGTGVAANNDWFGLFGGAITKWDNALINYLEEESTDKDITFEVKTGKNASESLSTSFPDFEDNEHKKRLTITATFTTLNSGKEELKEVNDNKDWTWECKVIFLKEKGDGGENLDLKDKEKIIGSEGFFNKLTNTGEKKLKIKFIKNCAKARNSNKIPESPDNLKISSERIFKPDKETDGWKIKQREFNNWFPTASGRK